VGSIGRHSLHENCLVLVEMLGAHEPNTAEKMQDFDVNSYGDAVWMMQQPTQEDNDLLKRYRSDTRV
jgi:hypothetical protein